jgi:hypothetical protein
MNDVELIPAVIVPRVRHDARTGSMDLSLLAFVGRIGVELRCQVEHDDEVLVR